MSDQAEGASTREIVVLEAVSDGVFALDTTWRVTLFNRAAEAYFGVTRVDVLGRTMADAFPTSVGSIYEECIGRVMSTGEGLTFVAPSVAVPNRTIEMRVAPTNDGVVVSFSDVTERKRAEDLLRRSEEQLRLVTDSVPALIGFVDREERYRFVNRGYADAFGQSRGAILGRSIREMIGEPAYARTRPYIQAALLGTRVSFDYVIPADKSSDGIPRDLDATYIPQVAGDGSVEGFYTLLIDVSERKKAAAAQAMLIGELQHRTRNLLGIVRAVSTQIRRTSGSLEEYAARFDGRLSALGRAQSLLAGQGGQDIALRDLITLELTAHGAAAREGRVSVDGPDVRLPARAVQILALALHELATNAVKYGAIGQVQARLTVCWELTRRDGHDAVTIRWMEDGVRMPDAQPDQGRGFGRELLERALPYDLGAETCLGFAPDGVRCEITVPLDEPQEVRGLPG